MRSTNCQLITQKSLLHSLLKVSSTQESAYINKGIMILASELLQKLSQLILMMPNFTTTQALQISSQNNTIKLLTILKSVLSQIHSINMLITIWLFFIICISFIKKLLMFVDALRLIIQMDIIVIDIGLLLFLRRVRWPRQLKRSRKAFRKIQETQTIGLYGA